MEKEKTASLQWNLRQLREQNAVSLLQGDTVPRVLVVRRESSRVRRGCWLAVWPSFLKWLTNPVEQQGQNVVRTNQSTRFGRRRLPARDAAARQLVHDCSRFARSNVARSSRIQLTSAFSIVRFNNASCYKCLHLTKQWITNSQRKYQTNLECVHPCAFFVEIVPTHHGMVH
jgi:hypothetical protein